MDDATIEFDGSASAPAGGDPPGVSAPPEPPSPPEPPELLDPARMPCSEVWGGNREVDRGVVTAGLDVWVWSRPAQDAGRGGDIHYVSSCASGRVTRLLVADVSGHGDVVAAEAERLRDLMRRFVNFVDPTRFVRAMNRRFAALEGDRFATAAVGTFFAPGRELSLCNAGHPPPVVRRPTGAWETVVDHAVRDGGTLRDLPLGVSREVEYRQVRVDFGPGDLAIMVSDGVLEARSPDGAMFGIERLLAALDRAAPGECEAPEPRAIVAAVREGLLDWTRSRFTDDTTVLVFRGNAVPSTVFDTLVAPFRVLGNYVSTRRLDARIR